MTITQTDQATALELERAHLLERTIAISHAVRELALTAELFSDRVGSREHSEHKLRVVDGHLVQLRRNCSEAQELANDVRSQIETQEFSWQQARHCDELLCDAQVRLTLADFAYDRAYNLDRQ